MIYCFPILLNSSNSLFAWIEMVDNWVNIVIIWVMVVTSMR